MIRPINAATNQFPPLRSNPQLLTVVKLFTKFYTTTPASWTQGAMYRDADRNPIGVLDGETTPAYFDLSGAVNFVYRNPKQNQDAKIRLSVVLAGQRVEMWNDAPGRTFEDVLDIVRKANI